MNSRGYLPSRFAPLGKIISSAVHLHFRWIIVNYLFWITMHCNAIHSGTNISIDGLIYTGFVPNILQIMNPLNSCPGARVGRTSLFWTEVIISILKCGRNTTDLFMRANIATYHSLIHSWHKVCIIIHNFVLVLFWRKQILKMVARMMEHSIVCIVYYSVTYGYRRIVLFCQLKHTQADWAL